MKYFITDFHVLSAVQNATTVEDVRLALRRNIGWSLAEDALASTLSVLASDQYITLQLKDGMLTPETAVTLTDKGRDALSVGGMAKLFSGAKEKAILKNEKRFCDLPRPEEAPLPADRAAFDTYDDGDPLLFTIRRDEHEGYFLTFGYHNDDEPSEEASNEEDMADGISVLCDQDTLSLMLFDLAETALHFISSRHTRKIALFGVGGAYILTFAIVADEEGYTVLRVTGAPILFNRRRFFGKRDNDLDYAQCGRNVFSKTYETCEGLCTDVLGGLCRHPQLLRETLGERVNELYRKIR